MKRSTLILSALCLAFGAHASPASADAGFSWGPAGDDGVDLTYEGRKVAHYVHPTLDETSKETREATYKPFHHVYDSAGENFITKGPGGQFTHHRGIFFGFSKCRYKDDAGKDVVVDTWHCKPPAFLSHEEILEQSSTADRAVQLIKINWHGVGGVFAVEKRRLEFSMNDAGALVVDFTSTLSTDRDKIILDGDPQHAGFQFRASNEVNDKTKKQTYYIRPGSGKGKPGETINWSAKTDTEATRNLPWKAMSFVIGGERYTTVYLDHPDNPKPARYSERDYGRFGSYFVAEVTPEKPLTVRYRLVISKGEIESSNAEELSRGFKVGNG